MTQTIFWKLNSLEYSERDPISSLEPKKLSARDSPENYQLKSGKGIGSRCSIRSKNTFLYLKCWSITTDEPSNMCGKRIFWRSTYAKFMFCRAQASWSRARMRNIIILYRMNLSINSGLKNYPSATLYTNPDILKVNLCKMSARYPRQN